MKFKMHKGDVIEYFRNNADVLFHQCNMMMTNASGTSQGVAGQLIKEFPIIKEAEEYVRDKLSFGTFLSIGVTERLKVFNLYTQYYPGSPSTSYLFPVDRLAPEMLKYYYPMTPFESPDGGKNLLDSEINRHLALRFALSELKRVAGGLRLCCPMIGSGLARPTGTDTAEYFHYTIRPLMEEALDGCDVTVCFL